MLGLTKQILGSPRTLRSTNARGWLARSWVFLVENRTVGNVGWESGQGLEIRRKDGSGADNGIGELCLCRGWKGVRKWLSWM